MGGVTSHGYQNLSAFLFGKIGENKVEGPESVFIRVKWLTSMMSIIFLFCLTTNSFSHQWLDSIGSRAKECTVLNKQK